MIFSREDNPAPQAECAKEGFEKEFIRAEQIEFPLGMVDVRRALKRRDELVKAANEVILEQAKRIEAIEDELFMLSASPPPPVAESGWQEIETAPKDEQRILGTDGVSRFVMFWRGSNHLPHQDKPGWNLSGGVQRLFPTHWMPLPAPPAIVADQRPEVK